MPLGRIHTGPDPVDCAIERRVGGRIFERAADGRETSWGTVLAYDPPHHLAFSWIVELTHSGWEKLGDAAASQRARYDRGWGTVFERHFVDYANSGAT